MRVTERIGRKLTFQNSLCPLKASCSYKHNFLTIFPARNYIYSTSKCSDIHWALYISIICWSYNYTCNRKWLASLMEKNEKSKFYVRWKQDCIHNILLIKTRHVLPVNSNTTDPKWYLYYCNIVNISYANFCNKGTFCLLVAWPKIE